MIEEGLRFDRVRIAADKARIRFRHYAAPIEDGGFPFNCETYLNERDRYGRARRALMAEHVKTGTGLLFDGARFPEHPYPLLDAIADGTN